MRTANLPIFFKAIAAKLTLFGNIMSFSMMSYESEINLVLLNHKIDRLNRSIELKKGNATIIIPHHSLHVREVSKHFAEYKPELLRLFYPLYPNKYTSEQCMLLDCIYNGRYEQTEYLLKQKALEQSFAANCRSRWHHCRDFIFNTQNISLINEIICPHLVITPNS
jgi:hypothetical protein